MIRHRSCSPRGVFVPAVAAIAAGLAVGHVEAATPEDRAAAEALFSEAGKLYREGKYPEACAKLADSNKLDPAVGTMINLGRCYTKIGKTASAWLTYLDAAAAAKAARQDDREQAARQAAAELQPTLATLAVDVPEAVARLQGLEVRRDGGLVPSTLWGSRAPVDPGEHEVTAVAPGKLPWSTKVTVAPAKAASVVVPVLQDAPKSAPTGPGVERGQAGTTASRRLGAQKIAGLVVAGAGVVGLGVAAGFGLSAMSRSDAAKDSCDSERCSTQAGWDANRGALDHATLSNVFWIAGGALAVGGAVLYFTAPSSSQGQGDKHAVTARRQVAVAPAWTGSFVGVAVQGAF